MEDIAVRCVVVEHVGMERIIVEDVQVHSIVVLVAVWQVEVTHRMIKPAPQEDSDLIGAQASYRLCQSIDVVDVRRGSVRVVRVRHRSSWVDAVLPRVPESARHEACRDTMMVVIHTMMDARRVSQPGFAATNL
jgi:hypothetical protein